MAAPAALARELAGQKVHVNAVRPVGRLRLTWSSSGAPLAIQRLRGTATTPAGRSTRTFTVTLISADGGWRLQPAG